MCGALLFIASAGELLGTAGCIALEKDWVVVLAAEISDNSDDAEESADTEDLPVSQTLRELNAMLQRIDLLCALLAPMLYGFLMGLLERGGNVHGDGRDSDVFSVHNKTSNTTRWAEENRIIAYGALSISAWNICSLLPEYYLALSLYNRLPALWSKSKTRATFAGKECSRETNNMQTSLGDEEVGDAGYVAMDDDDHDNGTAIPAGRQRLSLCRQLAFGWSTYLKSPVALPSLGYCLLYLTVLSNGVLMTQYLLENKVPAAFAGASRGVGAIFGITGTLIYTCLMRCRCCRGRGSLELSGVLFGWLFFITVAPAGIAVAAHAWGLFGDMPRWYFVGYTAAEAVPFVCLGFTLISRCWLWAFDVNHCQVMQEKVPEAERGIVSGTEAALYRLMTMLISVLGMVFQKPAQFYILALVSVGSVFFAAVSYTLWSLRSQLCCLDRSL